MTPADTLQSLAEHLGHRFSDQSVLVQSVTHRSWCAEHPGTTSNERLEFLGDAVLGLVVTDYAYAAFPDLLEGQLAKVRASVVDATTLAGVARELDLGAFLLLGKGEQSSGGRDKSSILCDALEAVIGALYIDGGWPVARRFVLEHFEARIAVAAQGPGGQDHKTRLQERSVRRYDTLPAYEVREDGPDHEKRFFATVSVDGTVRGRGEGRSKKEAEQAAARAAWGAMAGDGDGGAST